MEGAEVRAGRQEPLGGRGPSTRPGRRRRAGRRRAQAAGSHGRRRGRARGGAGQPTPGRGGGACAAAPAGRPDGWRGPPAPQTPRREGTGAADQDEHGGGRGERLGCDLGPRLAPLARGGAGRWLPAGRAAARPRVLGRCGRSARRGPRAPAGCSSGRKWLPASTSTSAPGTRDAASRRPGRRSARRCCPATKVVGQTTATVHGPVAGRRVRQAHVPAPVLAQELLEHRDQVLGPAPGRA